MALALLLQLLPVQARYELVIPVPASLMLPASPHRPSPTPRQLQPSQPDMRFARTFGLPFGFGAGSTTETTVSSHPAEREIRLPLPLGAAPALAQSPPLTLTKSASPDPVNQGERLSYFIVLTNTSAATINSRIDLTDTVPLNTVCAEIPDVIGWFKGSCDPQVTTEAFWLNIPGIPAEKTHMGPNEVVTLTFVVTVTEPLPDQTIITNLSSSYAVSSTGTMLFGANPVTTTVNAPEWTLTKLAQPDPVQPGQPLVYTLYLTNTGHLTTSGAFTLTDLVPQFTTFANASPPFTFDGQVVTWVFTNPLGIQQGLTRTLVVTPTLPLTDGLLIANNAYTVTGGNVFSDGLGPPLTVTVDAPADLTIVKAADPEPVQAGGVLTYTITVTNAGASTGPALNVVITDTLPPETLFQSASILPPFSGLITTPLTTSGVITWALNEPIPFNGSAQVMASVRITSPAQANTIITNTYSVTASNLPALQTGPPATSTISSTNVISLSKSVFPQFVPGGDVVTYTILVTNTGNGIANVALTDTLNPAFTGTTGLFTSTFVLPGRDLGGVPGQAARSFTVTAPITAGVYFNPTVTLTFDSAQMVITNSAPFTVAEPVLSITKIDDPDPVGIDQFLRYTIIYSNTGGLQADNVVLSDTLDPNVTFITSTLGAPDNTSGSELSWNLSPVPGTSGQITEVITVHVPITLDDLDVLSNTASIVSDRTALTDTGVITTLVHAPVLAIDKFDAPDPVQAGAVLTYNLRFTNTGNLTATNLIVTDTLDGNVALVSADPPTTTQIGGVVGWHSLPNLPPLGGNGVITAVVRVTSPLTDGTLLNNSAVITSAQLKGASVGPITTGVTSAPVFGLLKTESQDPIGAGERLTYTIAYSNSGNAVATGVLVTDTLDSNVTLVSVAPPTTTQAGQVLGWSVGVLSPLSGTQFITVVVDVN
ncbi:MAG: hypothetical protein ACE5H9_15715, partial [Anaerolineae bacterium]